MLQRARQDQENQKSLEKVGRLLDQAIAQVEDEQRAVALHGLLKDDRLELARLEDMMGTASSTGRREILARP